MCNVLAFAAMGFVEPTFSPFLVHKVNTHVTRCVGHLYKLLVPSQLYISVAYTGLVFLAGSAVYMIAVFVVRPLSDKFVCWWGGGGEGLKFLRCDTL